MNAIKASTGQLKYRHIFKLMFSCCFLYYTELDAMFVLCLQNYCSPEVKILRRQNSQTLWSLAKRHLKQGGQIVCLIFFFLYGNSGDSNRIFSDVFFAYNEKEIQHRWSLSFKLNRIRFIPSLLYGLKDVIASENSVFRSSNYWRRRPLRKYIS